MAVKKAKKYVMFWITSSRGTDSQKLVELPAGINKDDIKDLLEQWCSTFGAWDSSANFISYGFRSVKLPSRRELLKKWDKVCKERQRILKQHDAIGQMLRFR